MFPKRLSRDDDATGRDSFDNSSTLAAAALRNGSDRPQDKPSSASSDDHKISVFWRVFGGAIVSMVVFVSITLYNNIASSISELRNEVSRSNEARAELVKKDEFNNRSTSMWNRLQELQTIQVSVTSLKEQLAAVSERTTGAGRDMKQVEEALRAALASLKEKLTAVEQQLKSADEDHRAIMQMQTALSALQEKTVARDAQMKQMEEERRASTKELLELRERIAKLEGQQSTKPPPKEDRSTSTEAVPPTKD